MAKEKICGIYRIENLINHKSYIGQSVDIYERWTEHRRELNNKTHNNEHLTRAWHKYKEDNFKFTILEKCKEESLNDREIYWIECYDAYYNGYNQTKGGDGCLGKVWTVEERKNISRSVCQIGLNGEFIKCFINIDDAWKQTGINRWQIWNCANKHCVTKIKNGKDYEYVSKTAGGYIWVYEDAMGDFDLSWYKSKTPSYEVYQYDMHWNLIKIWPSAESVKENGYGPSVIRGACQGKFMTAYGYLWSYEIDDLEEHILWFKNHFEVKYVGQYDMDNNLVKIWNSAVETKYGGFNPSLVRDVLRGIRGKHRNYIFKYVKWNELINTNWKGQLNYDK